MYWMSSPLGLEVQNLACVQKAKNNKGYANEQDTLWKQMLWELANDKPRKFNIGMQLLTAPFPKQTRPSNAFCICVGVTHKKKLSCAQLIFKYFEGKSNVTRTLNKTPSDVVGGLRCQAGFELGKNNLCVPS